ncbi:L-tryptophan--pyruvate aminotransferase 1-like isoform X1 [Carex littledalei]|uniref:L-tryptophan--pyruvate aminotransferase 1-like isoform X1 n=1 Tax=Carex littledalei TaxID=544730 RepID=A0A833QNM7_9POAL|nr:L-tryptophan--pyruvate aminotransferase 1-like isoform X1 [Carex littledalei]
MARRRNVSMKERERFDRVAPPQQPEQRRLSVSLTVICVTAVLLLLTALVLFLFLFLFVNYHDLLLNLNPHHSHNELDLSSTSPTGDKDAVVNLDHGDPTMFEPFWKESGQKSTVVISGWHSMSYFSAAGAQLCWFLEPSFAKEVRRLHAIVGNAITDNRPVIVGVGSTQLIHAVFFALSSSSSGEPNQQPVPIVSAAPYYSMYPGIADLLKSRLFHWAGDASTFKEGGNSSFIEIVCSPNNPDGAIRRAVLDSEAGKQVHDLAYYWPQYTPMRGPADEDIMLFTVSKATGHAGTRIGWALVKDADVARKMVKFIEMNSIGVSKDSQIRAARILQVVSDGYDLPDSKAFAWLRCDDESIKDDCEGFFKSMKVLTRSGKHFGAGPEYVRISMLDRAHNFNLFVERISSSRGLG